MTRPNHGLRARSWAGRPTGLLLALLVLLATVAACSGGSDGGTAPAVSPAPAVPTTTMPRTAAPAAPTGPSRSTAAPVALPQPIREVRQGDRLFGVYWVTASLADLSPVERRLQALGYPPSSGELDCDRGARRWLGVPANINSRWSYLRADGRRAFRPSGARRHPPGSPAIRTAGLTGERHDASRAGPRGAGMTRRTHRLAIAALPSSRAKSPPAGDAPDDAPQPPQPATAAPSVQPHAAHPAQPRTVPPEPHPARRHASGSYAAGRRAGTFYLRFDRAVQLTEFRRRAGAQAASPGPNDYYIQHDNPRLREVVSATRPRSSAASSSPAAQAPTPAASRPCSPSSTTAAPRSRPPRSTASTTTTASSPGSRSSTSPEPRAPVAVGDCHRGSLLPIQPHWGAG